MMKTSAATPSATRTDCLSKKKGRAAYALRGLLSWLKTMPVFAALLLLFAGSALMAQTANAAARAENTRSGIAPGLAEQQREVVFIEGNLADVSILVAGVQPGREVHVLDASQDGLAQMAQILRGQHGVDAIHLLSHGS